MTCERGGRRVLTNLSFCCRSGTPLLVTGPNGVGKSTLLRLVAGFLRPSAGTLRVSGLDGVEGGAPLPEWIHYAGHLDGVKPALSVADNLMFWARYMGGAKAAVAPALERFGLERLALLPGGVLSAGQKRRLTLARLLLCQRPIWLLDEPTVSLDAESRAILLEVMTAHAAAGGVLMVASHEDVALPGAEALVLAPAAGEQAA